jgi:hypothetical protein
MERIFPAARVWPLPWAMLAALGLLAAVERYVARRTLDFSDQWRADRQWVLRSLRAEAPGYDLLCLGDSQVKFGVVPASLERRLGKRSINLALHGGQSPEVYFLLREVLRRGGRPATVVVDFKPWLLTHPVQPRLAWYAELLGVADCTHLARAAGDAGFLGAILARKALPSLGLRDGIRENTLLALRGEVPTQLGTILTLWRNWNRNRGAQVMPEGPYPRVPWELYPHLFQRWSCHPICERYLRAFLDLTAAHGIVVIYLLPPVEPVVQSICERSGFDEDYVRFVRGLQAGYGNLLVVDGRHSGYLTPAFCDPLHLNRLGAAVLSRDLAKVVARSVRDPGAVPGWVELPPFRPTGEMDDVEDLSASMLALQKMAEPRRR